MPKGQINMFPGAEFWLLKCPCMNGDSKHFKDKRAFDLYRKLHNKKCHFGERGYLYSADPSNSNLISPLISDSQLRSNVFDIQKKLYV